MAEKHNTHKTTRVQRYAQLHLNDTASKQQAYETTAAGSRYWPASGDVKDEQRKRVTVLSVV